MAKDFFDDQKAVADQIAESLNVSDEVKTEEVVEEKETPNTIKVGEKEYTQEELTRLVSLGEIGAEAETKFNTKIGNVWPEYTKSRAEIKQLQEQLEELKQGKSEAINDADNRDEVITAARKYGLMTADDVRTFYAEQRAAEKLLDRTEKLENDFNGADGRPKFEKIAILEYMRDNGINDPELAYKIKYEKELDAWKEKKISSAKKTDIVTNTVGGANKTPVDVRPNRDNLSDLIKESLGQ